VLSLQFQWFPNFSKILVKFNLSNPDDLRHATNQPLSRYIQGKTIWKFESTLENSSDFSPRSYFSKTSIDFKISFSLKALLSPFETPQSLLEKEKRNGESKENPRKLEGDGELLRLNEFLFTLNIDNLNLFKVLRFVQSKELIKKVVFISLFRNFLRLNVDHPDEWICRKD
jgi:hypothetical protein